MTAVLGQAGNRLTATQAHHGADIAEVGAAGGEGEVLPIEVERSAQRQAERAIDGQRTLQQDRLHSGMGKVVEGSSAAIQALRAIAGKGDGAGGQEGREQGQAEG